MSESQLVRCNTPDDYHRLLMQGLFPEKGPIRLPEWMAHGNISGELITQMLGLSEWEEEEELLEAVKQHCREQSYPMIVEYGALNVGCEGDRYWIHQHYLGDIPEVDTLFSDYGVIES